MYVDISNEDILMNDSFGFFLGIPHTREVCVGDVVDASSGPPIVTANKNFEVAQGPIYPVSGTGILPIASDISVWTRKTTDGKATDTAIASTDYTVDTVVDETTGDSIYSGIEFKTAPTTELVDSVVCSYVEELQPFVAQDVTPTVKQNTKEVGRIYSTDTMTGYGSINLIY